MKSLVHELRPRKFEEVRGQASAVAFLSGLILDGQLERNILLHGQVGSGKTTLARIYAAALNCEFYDRKTGSPCGECISCNRITDHDPDLFHEIAAPDFDRTEHLISYIDAIAHKPRNGAHRIIFVDEAHALVDFNRLVNRLLKPIEEKPDGVVYIFATSELIEIPAALRSRFCLLLIRPLSREESHRFMIGVLEGYGVHNPERSALDLIAGFSEYQPRNMLQCLDQLLPGTVTLERVLQITGSPEVDRLIGYFECLALGNSEKALIAFLDWPETISGKLTLIRLMILHVHLRFFQQIDVIVDPLIASISTIKISHIHSSFCKRISEIGRDPNVIWRDMIVFWREVPWGRDDESAMLDIALFHHEICNLKPFSLTHTASNGDSSFVVSIQNRLNNPFGPRLRAHRKIKQNLSEKHLHYETVGIILNTASACVQAYGLSFNTTITVWHSQFGHNTRAGASKWMSRFTKDMHEWIVRRVRNSPVCRMTLQEHDPLKGYSARTIVYVPEDSWDEFRNWCVGWKRRSRITAMVEPAVDVDLPVDKPRSDMSRNARHKACVRWLLASTDPEENACDSRSPQPKFRSLREMLDLNQSLRYLGTVEDRQRSLATSEALSQPELLRLARPRCMPFLSAFDDGAWDRVLDGWERREHWDRQREIERRDAEWSEAMSIPATGPALDQSPKTDDARALYQSWPIDPHDRPRSWKIWWSQGEL